MSDHNSWPDVERRRGRDWQAEFDTRLRAVEDRLDAGKSRFDNLDHGLAANTTITAEIDARTKEIEAKIAPIADAWSTLQSGLRVLGAIGKVGLFFAKHWALIVGAGAFLWAWTHGATIEEALREFWKGAAK